MSDAHPSLESQASTARPLVERPVSEESTEIRPRRIWRLVTVVQSVLLLAHWFLYATWIAFHPAMDAKTHNLLRIVFPVAAVSFVVATFLGWRYFNWLVRAYYTLCALWVGLMNFCLFAAALSWLALGAARLAGLQTARNRIADTLFTAAIVVGVYGVVNAARIRIHRVTVRLPNLPPSWRGRVAGLVSDMHLGHIRNAGFLRRIVARLNELRPDVVLIAGDMFDGTKANENEWAEPWSALSVPMGAFFVTGNHEEFTNRASYLKAVSRAGVRVLNNEKIELDGMQIVGVHYRETVNPKGYRAILQNASIRRESPSILLVHAPHRLPIAEEEGISLQLCGHTHGGQFPPGSWVTSRVYGPYVHGLNRFGRMLVFTNWGVGTWGPPLRVGTQPEIVLLEFDAA